MKWEHWSTAMDCYIITRVVCCRVDGRRRRQPPTPNFQPKVIQDSNLDFRIELDPEVCRICPKMLWMHYLAGISHFAKYGTNRSSIVWEMVTDVQKSPVPQWWRKWKSDMEFARRSGSLPKVDHLATNCQSHRLQVAICEPVEVDDDSDIFGRQRINESHLREMKIVSFSIQASPAHIAWLEPSLDWTVL